MKVLVVYCHPSDNSFTARMKDEFVRGLKDSNHVCKLLDLYQMDFNETFSEDEYLREAFYNNQLEICKDVLEQQSLIDRKSVV